MMMPSEPPLFGVGYLKVLGGRTRLRDDLYLVTDGNDRDSFRKEQHVFGCNFDQIQGGKQKYLTWRFVPEPHTDYFRIQSFEDPRERRWFLRKETDGYWDYVHCLSSEGSSPRVPYAD